MLRKVGRSLVLLLAIPVGAEEHRLGLGAAWLAYSGSERSFASQYNLHGGLFLEELHLDLNRVFAGFRRFTLDLAGFGSEPYAKARLLADWDHEWQFSATFERQRLFSALAPGEQSWGSERSRLQRFTGTLTYSGFSWAKLWVAARHVRRTGVTTKPFYGLGEAYVGQHKLWEEEKGGELGLETRGLPIKLLVEQDFAVYTRTNRAAAANDGHDLEHRDPDVLVGFATPGKDRTSVPTTRLLAQYAVARFEVQALGLFRKDDSKARRADSTTFALGGDTSRTVTFLDAVTGNGDRQVSRGEVRLGWRLAPSLVVRVFALRDETETTAELVGQRILRLVGPGGRADLAFDAADQGSFDATDEQAGIEAEFSQLPWFANLRGSRGQREVAFRRQREDPEALRRRDADTASGSVGFRTSRGSLAFGIEKSAFDRYILRVEPETMTRLWVRGNLALSPSLALSLAAQRGRADNPAAAAGMNAKDDQASLQLSWVRGEQQFLTVGAEHLRLASRVDTLFFAPQLTRGRSMYELELVAGTASFAWPLGLRARVAGNGWWSKDSGSSLPFAASQAHLELALSLGAPGELALFGEHFRFDQKHADAEDFDVARLGVVVRRRF